MKPLEILVAIPKWATATPDQILDSPAFAMPCRLGEEQVSLRLGAVQPGDTLDLAILFGDEPHSLRLARSPRFPELDKVWDSRADVPEPILLALVEKECGPLLQLLENAVRRQLRLVGLAANSDPDARMVFAQVNDVVFSLTRSETVTAAFGILRHLDFASPELRSETFTAETEYAAFALAAADLASLSVGDALLAEYRAGGSRATMPELLRFVLLDCHRDKVAETEWMFLAAEKVFLPMISLLTREEAAALLRPYAELRRKQPGLSVQREVRRELKRCAA